MSEKGDRSGAARQHTVNTKQPDKRAAGLAGKGTPRMPYERDESVDGEENPIQSVMKQAYDDLESGQVDTDRHGMRGVEALFDERAGAEEKVDKTSTASQPSQPSSSRTPSSSEKKN